VLMSAPYAGITRVRFVGSHENRASQP